MDALLELCSRAEQNKELKKFAQFHKENPAVFDALLTEVRLLVEKGWRAFSIVSLIHYLRWSLILEKKDGEPYALNDHTAPLYARALAVLFPDEFNGFFEFRGEGSNRTFGLTVEAKKEPGFYARRLMWADGTPLEQGWRPTKPYVPTHRAKRRPHVHARQESGTTWTCSKCGTENGQGGTL